MVKVIFNSKGMDDRVPKLIGDLNSFKTLENFYIFDGDILSRAPLKPSGLVLSADEYLLGGYPYTKESFQSYIVTNKRILLVDFVPPTPSIVATIHEFVNTGEPPVKTPLVGNPTPQIIENRFTKHQLGGNANGVNSLGSVLILVDGMLYALFQDNSTPFTNWEFKSSLGDKSKTPLTFNCICESAQGFILSTNGVRLDPPPTDTFDRAVTALSLFIFAPATGEGATPVFEPHWFPIVTKSLVRSCCKSGDNIALICTTEVVYLTRVAKIEEDGIQYLKKNISDDIRITNEKIHAINSLFFSGIFFDGDILSSVNAFQIVSLQTALPRSISRELRWGDGVTTKHLSLVGYNKDLINNQMYMTLFNESLNCDLLVVSLDNGRVITKYTHSELGVTRGFTGSLVDETRIFPYLIGDVPASGAAGKVFIQGEITDPTIKLFTAVLETHIIYNEDFTQSQYINNFIFLITELDFGDGSVDIETFSNGEPIGEVRTVPVSKLNVKDDRLILDIGATGYLLHIKLTFKNVKIMRISAIIIEVAESM